MEASKIRNLFRYCWPGSLGIAFKQEGSKRLSQVYTHDCENYDKTVLKLHLVQHLATAGSELSGSQAAQGAISKLQYPMEIHSEISFSTGPWILFSHKFGRWCLSHQAWGHLRQKSLQFSVYSALPALPVGSSMLPSPEGKEQNIAPDISTQSPYSPCTVEVLLGSCISLLHAAGHCFTRGPKFGMSAPKSCCGNVYSSWCSSLFSLACTTSLDTFYGTSYAGRI